METAPMKSRHTVMFADSRKMDQLEDSSVDLVVTSPPYPMIEMWDDLFASLSPETGRSLAKNDGAGAFERMHRELDRVWHELDRVVKPSGFVCINIGDATRKIGSDFQLYSNHSRITTAMVNLGFQPLPIILWKKATNSPNKFMGSGMLPAGAYVTLEHEYILIFRKGGKREFLSKQAKQIRNESAVFWEERNTWYSDTWTVIGTRQRTGKNNIRERNAAYPFEIPYRLVNMYSVKGDTVLDPFLGTGTTTAAAIVSERNSVGLEYDENFADLISETVQRCPALSADIIQGRLENHKTFVKRRIEDGKKIKHMNTFYKFPVVTKQETRLRLNPVLTIHCDDLAWIETAYTPETDPQPVVLPPLRNTDPQRLLFD